ncbi:cation:dicarboxylase symporter family transporter, partial [Anoxybacillus flavithermus]
TNRIGKSFITFTYLMKNRQRRFPLSYQRFASIVKMFCHGFRLQKKHLNFGTFVFLSMILGVLAGIVFKDSVIVFDSIGQVYVHLIKMLVVPLVFTTLITSLISLEGHIRLKRIGLKTISWFLVTAALASLLGLLIAKIFNPGRNVTLSHGVDFQPIEIPPINEVLVNFIPSNPIGHMANGEVIPIVIFTLLLGIALNVKADYFFPKIVGLKFPRRISSILPFFFLESLIP